MSVQTTIFYFLSALVLGSTAYSLIAIYAVLKFARSKGASPGSFLPSLSLIKPLYGAEPGLEKNLESFFAQDYPKFEILFSVRELSDPSVAVVNRLKERYPGVSVKLIVTGVPVYLNAKVYGMEEMVKAATHEFLAFSDSDVLVSKDYLRRIVAPLEDDSVGLVTCLARAVPESSFGSLLEAITINTQFFAGVLSAWLLIGVEFALGPTMVTRKKQIREIGGITVLGDYLADDFVLGELVAKDGYKVVLSKTVPEHHFGSAGFAEAWRHRLRWERSSRISRPAGYIGQIFMHNIPLALLMTPWIPAGDLWAWCATAACILSRSLLALLTGALVLDSESMRKNGWLLPIADLVAFAIWCWAFAGSEVIWRGSRFRVIRGGKIQPVTAR